VTTQVTTPHPPGATLHLGGNAWASPDLEPLLIPIDAALPFPGNPRRHDQDGITASIRDHGLYQGIVGQASTGYTMVGNGRLQALLDLGATRVPRTLLDVDDVRARAIVARDNRTSDLSTNDDALLLELLAPLADDADLLALAGYDSDDLSDLLHAIAGEGNGLPTGPEYTRKSDPIHYRPTAEVPPEPSTLVDHTKAKALLAAIRAADLPPDVRTFLEAGAQRHLRFDYAAIAEFYAHAPADVQRLMEASALVIVDFDDAIEHGYVRLSARLAELRALDVADRDAGAVDA